MLANATRVMRSGVGWWRDRPTSTKDIVLAAALTVLAFLPALSAIGTQLSDLPRRPQAALGVALTVAQTAPLTVRSRWPAACLAVVGTAFAVHQAMSYPQTFGSTGLYLALYAAGAHQVRFRRGVAALASAGYAALALRLHDLGAPLHVQDFLVYYLVLAASWVAGWAVRRWRAQEARRRALSAAVVTAAERSRIARELHDVVTHHVTAMVVQADAAQYLLGAPDRAADGLTAISDTGRRALTELRHLLGVLEAPGERPAADRAPTLGRVADLVERARLSGQPVELTEHGRRRPRPVDVELAAYRVVQEALTNAVKHATGAPTAVLVHHHDDHIEIEVTTDGPARGTPAVPSGGRGLAGLRQRVGLLDGELVAAARPDGGFRVRARIPDGGER